MDRAFEPRIVAFVCNWCTYAGADLAGTSRIAYDPNVRIIKLPCTGRISPLFILKALQQGADGVLVSGCHPGDCHYTAGNHHARRKFRVLRELLHFLGVEPERLQFTWVSAAEGRKWADVVSEVTQDLRRLGPRQVPWGQFDRSRKPACDGAPEPEKDVKGSIDESLFLPQAQELRAKARDLLENSEVGVVVGYGRGSLQGMVRPIFVTSPQEVEDLVWNQRCRHNLSVYLTKDIVTKLGKVGLVMKGCDERSAIALMQENQIAREDFVLIGMACNGMQANGELAKKCVACQVRAPSSADHLIGEVSSPPAPEDPRLDEIAHLEGMSFDARRDFWAAQFDRCLKCYACRAACPLCYCERCLADKTQPRWIPSAADGPGNLSWHAARALHLAGRCADCEACAQACPAGIRLDLLNRKMAQVVHDAFGYTPGRDPSGAPPLTMFREDDRQEFIR